MGVTDKLKGLATNVQEGVKTSTVSMTTVILRMLSGAVLGLTIALIGQELSGYGTFSLLFCALVVFGLFMRISASWRLGIVLVFDLICILVAQLLRMYILLAP